MSDSARDPQLSHELLFELNPNPMWVFETSTLRFLAVNQTAVDRYGYTREEFLAMTIRDIRPPDGFAQLDRWLASPPAAREFPTATVHRKKDGSLIDVEIYARPFPLDGRDAHLVCAIDVTARTRAEAAARRLRAVVEKGADGVILTDAGGMVTYASPGMARMIGVPAEEIVGHPATWRVHPDDLAREVGAARDAMRTTGATHTMTVRQRHGGGAWRWIESTSTNLLDDPTVHAIVTTARDVSERVAAEAALRDARGRLAHLLGATAAVIWSMGPGGSGPPTFVGENVRDLLGYEPDDFLREPDLYYSLLHPGDAARVRGEIGAFAADPAVDRHATEYRVRHKAGGYRWIRDEAVARRDAAGAVVEIIGCWIDISARREMEDALRRSEETFRALTDHLPIGVMVHRAGALLYANRAIAGLLGYADGGAVRGRSLFEIAAPEMADLIRRRIDAFEHEAPTYQPPKSGELLRCDGSRVEVEAEALRIDFDGAPAMLLLVRDLSERNEMVARMAVADRMRSVGMLAAGVAHEINNPLAYVLANLERVVAELGAPGRAGDAGLLRQVEDAREGALRVREVVRDLRMLSRVDDEPGGAADVREVLESCMKMAENEIRFRARLVTDFRAVSRARGTPSRLAQVFLNLLINAAHAIPEGKADEQRITVRLREERARVIVEVADTGVGIPPSILGRIFDPFFTTKPAGIGTGLGLAICHGIVKSIGGEIDVESASGRGTTFRVSLPIADEAPAPAPAPAAPAPAARRGKVLVVDDEPAIGRALRLLFEHEHDVETVTRARDALTRIGEGARFDAILCDLMMPEMNGMELHAVLTQIAPDQASRMVFVTGGAFTREAQEFLARCERPPLEKPFDPAAVGEVLRRMVG